MKAAATDVRRTNQVAGGLSLAAVAAAPGLLVSLLGLAGGLWAFLGNSGDRLGVPLLAALAVVNLGWAAQARLRESSWRAAPLALGATSVVLAFLLLVIPEYNYGYQVNGIVHRSLFSSLFLFIASLPSACYYLWRFLGGSPTARDWALYPVLVLPVLLTAVAYGLLVERLVADGLPDLSLGVLTDSYSETLQPTGFVYTAGMRDHILGTFLLIALTAGLSIPIGVGAGVFIHEYRGLPSRIVEFSTTMLRAISVFIIGVAAFSLVDALSSQQAGDFLSDLIRGYYTDDNGIAHPATGSFLTGSAFLSLLVIPIIARSTVEGLASVPRDIREGSRALGSTDGHALLRILLPWSAPNIITGVLLGAAEAAGTVSALLFIAGTGQHGVGPQAEVSSLSYVVFGASFGPPSFQNVMGPYQFTAALLLVVITLGFTVAALVLKARFGKRYRGTLTAT